MLRDDELGTSRLLIRPFHREDARRLVEIFADPLVARYVDDGTALSLKEAERWISKSRDNLSRYGYGTGAVALRSNGRVIGWAGFARPPDGLEQIIYGLAAENWRQGFGAEILGALINFAMERGKPQVFATVDPANSGSIALLLAHGFERVKSDRNTREVTQTYLYRLHIRSVQAAS